MGKAVHFGYGLTETSSGVALSLGSDPYAMTVCPDDAIDIAPDGEVLISAPTCVMEGYWRRPDDTRQTLRARPIREVRAEFSGEAKLGEAVTLTYGVQGAAFLLSGDRERKLFRLNLVYED